MARRLVPLPPFRSRLSLPSPPPCSPDQLPIAVNCAPPSFSWSDGVQQPRFQEWCRRSSPSLWTANQQSFASIYLFFFLVMNWTMVNGRTDLEYKYPQTTRCAPGLRLPLRLCWLWGSPFPRRPGQCCSRASTVRGGKEETHICLWCARSNSVPSAHRTFVFADRNRC